MTVRPTILNVRQVKQEVFDAVKAGTANQIAREKFILDSLKGGPQVAPSANDLVVNLHPPKLNTHGDWLKMAQAAL